MTEAQAPLTVGRGLGGGLALLDYGKTIALLGEGELAEADGRRLAAAFNACKGISTEWLEGCAKTGSLFSWSEDSRRLVDAEQLLGDLASAVLLLVTGNEAPGLTTAFNAVQAFLNPEGDSAAGSEVVS